MTDTLYAFIKHSSFGDQSDFQCWLCNLLAVRDLGQAVKKPSLLRFLICKKIITVVMKFGQYK